MSESADQAGPPSDPEQLKTEIEQTRQQLGDTVDQLAAKADVKGRAQAKAADLTQQAKDTAAQVKKQAAARADQVKQQAATTAGQVKQQASTTTGQVKEQAVSVAGAGQEQLQARTPESVKRAAATGLTKARQNPKPLAIAAGVLALGAVIIRRWRRR
jgi:ABC-type transporter Mla subunit MlaD